MSRYTEQVNRVNQLRNRHVAKLLTNLAEINQLPTVVENEIKREFSFFADDIMGQVISNQKVQGAEKYEQPKQP